MTEHIVMYGKGGVGTTTVTSNISAALAAAGFKVLQIGCSSVADSCITLNGGLPVPTICDVLRKQGRVTLEDVALTGVSGVSIMEIGTPQGEENNVAACSLDAVFGLILKERIIEGFEPDFVLYDISGDELFSRYYRLLGSLWHCRLYVVTTADFMSLRSVNKVFEMIERHGRDLPPLPFGGLIPNGISNSFEDSFVTDFAAVTSSTPLGRIPRSLIVRQCELYGKTVIEASPLSNQSYYYRRLANQFADISRSNPAHVLPRAMTPDRLQEWAGQWADRLFAIENGLVSDGAAI